MAYDPIIYGGSKSSVKGYSSTRAKYWDDWRKEQEKKNKDTVVFGDNSTSSKAAAVKDSKGLWGTVGDFIGGVGKTVGEGVVGTGQFVYDTARSTKNLFDIKGEQDKESKYLKSEKAINDKYTSEANDKVWKGYENAKSVDELPADRQAAWKDIQARRTQEMDAMKGSTERGNSERTKKLFDEQKQIAESFDKSGTKSYKLLQYLPGFSLGAEGVGTIAAGISGEDSDVNKRLIKLTQDLNWDELTDEQKDQAIKNRNLGAALSTLDLLPVAGKAAGAGIKAGVNGGLKEGAKAAAEAYGKSVGSKTIGELVSVGGKEIAKQSAKSSITGAVVGAGLGVGLNAVMGGDNWKQAAIEGAKGGFIGGFIGSPLDIDPKAAMKAANSNSIELPDETIDAAIKEIDATKAASAEEAAHLASRKAEFEQIMQNRASGLNDDGSRFINLDEVNKEITDLQNGKYSDDLYDITTQDGKNVTPDHVHAAVQQQVDLLTLRRDEIAKQIDGIEDPAARELAMQGVNKIDDQIAQLNDTTLGALIDSDGSGVSRTLNTERVRERFNQLQNDLAEGNFRERIARTEAEKRTAPARTFDSVSDDMDALGAGGVAPEAVTPRPDFVDIDEVVRNQVLPEPIKKRAIALARDKNLLEQQRANIMTAQKAGAILDEADAKFNQDAARIEMMPEPRRTAEMEKLQSQYDNLYETVQSQVDADAQVAKELDMVEEQITANTNEVLADANIIKDNHPTEFGQVDEAMNQEISQMIESDTKNAIFNRMSHEDGVSEAENVSRAFAEVPVERVDEVVTSPQIGALTREAISDTFTNEGVKMYGDSARALDSTYAALSMSSASHNLDKIFGERGRELFGNIVKGYAHVSTANEKIAQTLTEIKKAFGGDKTLYSKAVDVLEGKSVDLKDFNPAQVDAIGKVKDLYAYGARQVRKLAYNDVVHAFEKRYANGNISYTLDEIKQFAKRDGLTLKLAKEKYGNITDFSKSDINFLATKRAENSTLDNYFPHMFDDTGREVAAPNDEYITTTGNIKFGNMLHRLADEDNYSRDIIDVSARYFSSLNKKTYLEPVLREIDNAKLAVKAATSDASSVWKWLDKYEAQLKYNKSDIIGKSWNEMIDKTIARVNPNSAKIGGDHYRNLLATQRQVNALAALGLSFRNAIQQTTQLGTTIGNIGVKDTVVGMVKYLKQSLNPTTHKQYMKLLDEHGITHAGIAREAYSDLLDDGISGVAKTKGEKFASGLMIMTQKMDEFARASTYEGSLTAKLKSGMPRAKAEALATADAARMNFMTSKVDMPIALNGSTVRSLTQFMTFSYKQAEAWKDLGLKVIKNPETGKYGLQPKSMVRLLEMAAFYGLAFEGMSQVAGIEPEDNIPFYGNIFGDSGLPKSPIVSILFGQNENTPGLLEIVGGIANPEGDNEFEQEENRQAMFEKFTDMMIRSFVPAGSQGKKSWEGYQSTQNDGVVSKDGQVRFIQNTDEASKLKATLFGKYSTDAGREWINKEFPTLSKKQSEILEQQNNAESKKRAYDFYSGLKSVGTKGTVTPKIKETMATQPNKAERLISDHNKAVEEAIKAYTSKYGGLSEYEQDYLLQNYFITKGNLENITEED